MQIRKISKMLALGVIFNSFNLNSYASTLSEDTRYETFVDNNITINDVLEEDKVDMKIEGNSLVNNCLNNTKDGVLIDRVVRFDSSMLNKNKYKTMRDIEIARQQVNRLENSNIRTELQGLLNNIIPVDMPTISKEQTSSMLDLYIKPINHLNVSLDTNYISFEDFNGVNDIEKNDAINITVNSTLPYSVEVSMPTNVVDEENTAMVDKNIFSIKESSSDTYQTFDNSTEYLILLDNQSSGGANNHSIDIKLNAKVLPTTSIYKTVLKFKIEQK